MYVILDKNLNRVGMLTVNGGFGTCPFWGDSVSIQIADQSNSPTLDDQSESFNAADPNANTKNWNHVLSSIYVPYGYPETGEIVQGSHLAYKDETNNHWYVMRLTDIKDVIDVSGTHYKSCVGVNLAIWDLIHTKLDDLKAPMASCEDAFRALLAKTSWTIGTVEETGGTASITFSKSENAQAKLQTLCQTYDCEIDAYMEFDSAGQPTTKTFDIVHELGVDDGVPVTYGDELVSMERVSTDENLFTRLYPYNSNGDGIEDVNNGVPYVENVEANDEYNTRIVGVDGPKFLEGSITSKSIENHGALRDWAKGILAKFDHPRINYSIQIGSDFTAGLGDHIRIKDMEMLPKAAVDARVIQKTFSQADPTQDQVIVGEFATVKVVTPGLIENLQKIMNRIDAVKAAQKDASSITTTVLTPDGSDFTDQKDKRFIMQAWEGKENITSYFDPQGFVWTDILADGTFDESFVPDTLNGYLLNVHHDYSGNTVRAQFDTRYLSTNPEIQLNEPGSTLLGDHNTVDAKAQMNGIAEHALQYCQQLKDGTYISSHSYTDSTGPETNFVHWQSDFKTVIEYMLVGSGGHGASFGVDYDDDDNPWIWANVKDTVHKTYPICHFKYEGGTTGTWQSRSKKNDFMVYASPTYYDAINYDQNSGYIGLRNNSSGTYSVLNVSDVKAGKIKPLYTIKYSDYGYDRNLQTYQSQCLNFPYVYFHSGNYDGHDIPTMYGLNVVTNSPEFVYQYDFATITKTGTYPEPETLNIFDDDNLLVGFNMGAAADGLNHEVLWKVPITHRAPMTAIDDTLAVDDDDDETDDADVTDTTDVTEGGD